MQHRKLKFFFFLSAMVFCLPELSFTQGPTIGSIIVYGNEKTQDTLIKRIIPVKVGDSFNANTPKVVKEYLENQRKYSQVAVGYRKKNNQITLYIYVKDKWSLVAAPYYSYKDNEHSAGLIFVESNLLGYQNILLFSFFYEYRHLNGTFVYSHPRVLGSPFSFYIQAKRLYSPVIEYKDNKELESYTMDKKSGKLELKYQFYGEHYLMFKINQAYYRDDFSGFSQNRRESFFQVYLELDWLHFQNFLTKGFYLGMFYEKDWYCSDIDRSIAGFKSELFLNPFAKQNLYLALFGYHSFKINRFFEPRIGQDSSGYFGPLRGYEKEQIRSLSALTASVEYRIPLFEAFSTTMIAAPFFDAAYTAKPDKKKLSDFHYSSGLALRFYLKEVLIPALQVYVGYGWKYKNTSVGFMIGTRL